MSILGRPIVALLPFVPRFIVRWISKRYVAGENIDEAMSVIKKLRSSNTCFTIDVLGEEIKNMSEASYFMNEYSALLDAIIDNNIDANISIKPTALGLLIDGEETSKNLTKLLVKASKNNIFVRLDMEDNRVTQSTIDLVYEMHKKGLNNVGTVLQGRLFRTENDIENICSMTLKNSDFRICKGIYLESNDISYTNHKDIVDSVINCINLMLENGAYTAIASHDDDIIACSLDSLKKHSMGPELMDPRKNAGIKLPGKGNGYEFQFLLGVRGNERRKLAKKGHLTRVYVPYGSRWYEYSMRRLRENPEIAMHVAKAFLLPWTNRR